MGDGYYLADPMLELSMADGVMLIHVVEVETNRSFYFYKNIPETAPTHSQKQLWEIGCQYIADLES